jgi:hypothetical protein
MDDRFLFSLLETPPRNHPDGRTNTSSFGGGHETGGNERENWRSPVLSQSHDVGQVSRGC